MATATKGGRMTVQVEDVAAAVLDRCADDKPESFKLQKLVYYVQAWYATWRGRPLFEEPVEAWENGPVVRKLYNMHRGARFVHRLNRGNRSALPADAMPILDYVMGRYGHESGDELTLRVHDEAPWMVAYFVRGQNSVISIDEMTEFYASQPESEQGWYWSADWWSGEKEADVDIATGRVTHFDSDEDFLSSL
jgi:uncharacterized phage-associated protein